MGSPAAEAPIVRRIVTDTGPVLHLGEADAVSLLPLAGTVAIPPAVASELIASAPRWLDERLSWLLVEDLAEARAEEAATLHTAGILGLGEAEAIALAHQLQAHWFLTDDLDARIVAEERGLEVHRSAGVILWAAASDLVDRPQAEQYLEQLMDSSLWLSASMRARIRAALRAIFE